MNDRAAEITYRSLFFDALRRIVRYWYALPIALVPWGIAIAIMIGLDRAGLAALDPGMLKLGSISSVYGIFSLFLSLIPASAAQLMLCRIYAAGLAGLNPLLTLPAQFMSIYLANLAFYGALIFVYVMMFLVIWLFGLLSIGNTSLAVIWLILAAAASVVYVGLNLALYLHIAAIANGRDFDFFDTLERTMGNRKSLVPVFLTVLLLGPICVTLAEFSLPSIQYALYFVSFVAVAILPYAVATAVDEALPDAGPARRPSRVRRGSFVSRVTDTPDQK